MKLRHGASGLVVWGAVVLLASSGCQGSGAVAQVNEKLAAIGDGQSQILKRLDELEGKIGTAPAGPAAVPGKAERPQQPQGQQAGRPDPTATYKVAIGDAHTKGPADAKITIAEWSDFQ
jgi:hypothetical protein